MTDTRPLRIMLFGIAMLLGMEYRFGKIEGFGLFMGLLLVTIGAYIRQPGQGLRIGLLAVTLVWLSAGFRGLPKVETAFFLVGLALGLVSVFVDDTWFIGQPRTHNQE